VKQKSRVVCVLVAILTATTAAGGASADVSKTGRQVAPGSTGSRVVTLITGDNVTASPGPDGGWTLGLSGPSPRADLPVYSEFSKKRGKVTDKYLVPGAAAELVQSGVLEVELFNITGLIRQGYDDAKSDAMPLLVQYNSTAEAARSVAHRAPTQQDGRGIGSRGDHACPRRGAAPDRGTHRARHR
jgi:hypothetical protein